MDDTAAIVAWYDRRIALLAENVRNLTIGEREITQSVAARCRSDGYSTWMQITHDGGRNWCRQSTVRIDDCVSDEAADAFVYSRFRAEIWDEITRRINTLTEERQLYATRTETENEDDR